MDLRRELLATSGALLALNLVLAFGAIGLFVRMGPAIEHILEENMHSIVAAEEVLAELIFAGPAPLSPDAGDRVREALERAKRNVTDAAERPVLAALELELPRAVAGDPEARVRTGAKLRELIHINREAMHDADADARRLGNAGAWAAVLIGFGSFLLSLFVVTRFRERLVRPLIDLQQVFDDVRQGNRLRRCRVSDDAPRELQQLAIEINKLLDERLRAAPAPVTPALASGPPGQGPPGQGPPMPE